MKKKLDLGKILGLAGIVASAVVTTLMTDWMTNREIESKVDEAVAKREREGA